MLGGGRNLSTATIDALCDAGLLLDIDRAFANLIAECDGRGREEVALAAALASARCRAGHVYLDLSRVAGVSVAVALDAAADASLPPRVTPELPVWRRLLRESPAVAGPGITAPRPLVLDERDRLYLARFRSAERRVVEGLLALAAPRGTPGEGAEELLDALFGNGRTEGRAAARTVLERGLCVVTGGPGTGKTTLAARLIALLVGTGLARPDGVRLVAPTGKAAARLQEAVGAQMVELAAAVPALDGLAVRASTVHRLLSRMRWDSGAVPFDALVLDEASMVDLTLMARLVRELPDGARLIVLGDADQLASVQPGAVLGDLCAAARRMDSPLGPCVVVLRKSYRFDAEGGIGRLAAAIVAGDAAAALQALRDGTDSATGLHALPGAPAFARLASTYADAEVVPGIRALRAQGAAAAPFPGARVLCAHRTGPFGAERFNRLVEDRLRAAGIVAKGEPFYAGRPIIVTRNDPLTGLSNGDTGVVLRREGADGETVTRVWFPEVGGTDEPFEVAPARLPEHESFFALTVHRAQGSEYDEVAFVPGAADSRVLTRELFYTAVTRARHKVTVHGDAAAVSAAVERRTERAAGLALGDS